VPATQGSRTTDARQFRLPGGPDAARRAAKDPSHTRQSSPALAAFRPWGSSARWRRTRGRSKR